MANPQNIRAGRAYVALGTENRLSRGLRAAEKQLRAFGAKVRRIGMGMVTASAAVLAPLAASVKVFADMGDQMHKMSARTEVAVESLSLLAHAAQQSGTDMKFVEKGLRRMQRSLYDAGRGLSTAVDGLEAMGLTFEDLEGLSPEEQFRKIAGGLNSIEDASTRAGVAQAFLGRSGTYLLPMFRNLDAEMAEAEEWDLGFGQADADQAAALTDAWSLLGKILKRTVFTIGSALAPTLTGLVRWIQTVAHDVGMWMRENKDLVVTVAKVAVAVGAAGVALIALGTAISVVGFALGGIATLIGAVGAVLSAVLSPIGLVIAGLAGLAAYLAYVSGYGAKMLKWLQERFKGLADFAGEAFGAIKTAMQAGEWKLAARILWLTLKVAWHKGIHTLLTAWDNFGVDFLKAAVEVFYGVQAAFAKVAAAIARIWHETAATVKTTAQVAAGLWDMFWRKRRHRREREELVARLKSGRITQAEFEAEKRRLGERQQAEIDAGVGAVDAKLTAIDQELEARLDEIDAAEEAELASIGKAAAERTRQVEGLVTTTKTALDDAREAWRKAVAEAQGLDVGDGEGPPGPPKTPAENVADLLEGATASVADAVKRTVGVRGTFSAAAAAGLAAGNATDRLVNANERTAKNTSTLVRRAADGLAFE